MDTIFALSRYVDIFKTHLYCLVGCLSMIVWTLAVLDVFYACVLYFCICTCSALLRMFHNEKRSRKTLLLLLLSCFVPSPFVSLSAERGIVLLVALFCCKHCLFVSAETVFVVKLFCPLIAMLVYEFVCICTCLC